MTIASPEIQPLTDHINRESVLKRLLPYDFDYARDSGLIDLFAYDETTGYDGLVHTLAGTVEMEQGAIIPGGFHHEPSAEVVWPVVVAEDGKQQTVTRVERDHVASLSQQKRRRYAEYPMEPYEGRVVIGGLQKMRVVKDATGDKQLVPARNSMFPKEYDALAVMQAVRQAYASRDRAQDILTTDSHGWKVIMTKGEAQLLDGVSTMKISLLLRADDKRVLTAAPIVPSVPGVMRLNNERMWELLTNQSQTGNYSKAGHVS